MITDFHLFIGFTVLYACFVIGILIAARRASKREKVEA
jgi:hypothetical protein